LNQYLHILDTAIFPIRPIYVLLHLNETHFYQEAEGS